MLQKISASSSVAILGCVLTKLAIENYRSIRRLVTPLSQLNVVTGSNGTGKSSLYRALRLLGDASRNGAVAALAREGGLSSTLWAGARTKTKTVMLRLGFAADDFGYAVDFGIPQPTSSAFGLDPEIKREALWAGPQLRPAALLVERGGPHARVRNVDGQWDIHSHTLQPFDSMLSELADPRRAPELLMLRDRVRSWRFYDHLRTDVDAPARHVQIGTRTVVLASDGVDLAAALQTIREIGSADDLDESVEQAFPGSRVEVVRTTAGHFEIAFHQHGLRRPLTGAELSDGTLRYLFWVAALLTPRPPGLLVLNEPETSLHPDLLPALAHLVAKAANTTQVIAVTHSGPFLTALEAGSEQAGVNLQMIELVKTTGATAIAGQRLLDEPPWTWPAR